MNSAFRRTLVLWLVAATAVLLGAGPTQAAVPTPPTPDGLPAGVEALASYVGAVSCDARPKPGSTALGDLLTGTYPGTSFNVPRDCGADALATSEHYDGRAVDWMVNGRDSGQRAQAAAALNWMLATDARGNAFANARRLGVMYVIWNNRSWSAYRPADGWREYSGCLAATKASASYDTTCHRNHVHLSLSWEGAMKRTSYWTQRVAAPEYGPCRVADLNWAPPSTAVNPTRCATLPRVDAPAGASALAKTLVGYSGMWLAPGSNGPAVRAVQAAIGTGVDGAFGPGTRAALLSWQQRTSIAPTGVTDAGTWRALLRAQATPRTGPLQPAGTSPTVGFDGDGRGDVLGRTAAGSLYLYAGTGTGAVRPGRVVGTGWAAYTQLLSPGDFTGDGQADLVGRHRDGRLVLWPGTGTGSYQPGRVIGNGWQVFDVVLSPGDFTGDRRPDLLARRPDGRLYLYAGNGRGGFAAAGKVIGSGWQGFNQVLSAGDLNRDGKADVIARRRTGQLVWYAGNGRGGWASGARTVGTGWQMFDAVFSAGDLTGDGEADLLARTPAGRLHLYAGKGDGTLQPGRVIGSGWQMFDLVTGVR